MTKEEITKAAERLRRIYGIMTPSRLCKQLDLYVEYMPLGTASTVPKGLIVRNNRCSTIIINSDINEKTQQFVLYHEIAHYVLKHHDRKKVCAFKDYEIFKKINNTTMDMEDEANLFVAEYLLENQLTLDILQESDDFFQSAARLRVPAEILDYKLRMLHYYNLISTSSPIYTKSNCMANINCSDNESSDYA